MSVGREKEVFVCPNVWYTFGKILKMKFEGIGGWIRKYRFRFNLIVFIYSKELVQHNIKVSETFTVISNFLCCFNSIFGRNSQNGQWEKIFFSVQSSETGNLLKNKSCENVWKGYNDFASRTFDYVKGSKKTHKGAMYRSGP